MPVEEDIRSSCGKLLETPAAGAGDISDNTYLTFTRDSGSGIPELELRGSALKCRLSQLASDLVDSDNWHEGDLGEKKGDWFAEKNAEDDDDMFLKVVDCNAPNLELSSPKSMCHKRFIKFCTYSLELRKSHPEMENHTSSI